MLHLRSRLRRELLAYFFLNPAAEHYVRELAGILKVDPTNLSRELSRLERDGLFTLRVRGNQKHFRLNAKYPLFHEVRGIVLKSAGIVPMLRRALSGVPKIKDAYLYGSLAKKQSDKHSDIDILIIGEPDLDVLEAAVRHLERSLRREVNYTLFDEREFKRKLASADPFVEDVWHGKRIRLVAA